MLNLIKRLITTSEQKDYTVLEDWLVEGDTDGMTPEEIAQEWDELPEMETDN